MAQIVIVLTSYVSFVCLESPCRDRCRLVASFILKSCQPTKPHLLSNQTTNQATNPSSCQPTIQSTILPIKQRTKQSPTKQPTRPLANRTTNQPRNPPSNQPTHEATKQSVKHDFDTFTNIYSPLSSHILCLQTWPQQKETV